MDTTLRALIIVCALLAALLSAHAEIPALGEAPASQEALEEKFASLNFLFLSEDDISPASWGIMAGARESLATRRPNATLKRLNPAGLSPSEAHALILESFAAGLHGVVLEKKPDPSEALLTVLKAVEGRQIPIASIGAEGTSDGALTVAFDPQPMLALALEHFTAGAGPLPGAIVHGPLDHEQRYLLEETVALLPAEAAQEMLGIFAHKEGFRGALERWSNLLEFDRRSQGRRWLFLDDALFQGPPWNFQRRPGDRLYVIAKSPRILPFLEAGHIEAVFLPDYGAMGDTVIQALLKPGMETEQEPSSFLKFSSEQAQELSTLWVRWSER